jgi:translation elongation factor EF-1alpha
MKVILLFHFLHKDAGKSTIGGQIMSLTGMVDKRTLEKYEREAREKSRESWYLSWALDTNQEGKHIPHILIALVN